MMTTWTWALPLASLSHANVLCAKWIFVPFRTEHPEDANLLALGDTIGRDKSDPNARALNIGNSFQVPGRYIVEQAMPLMWRDTNYMSSFRPLSMNCFPTNGGFPRT